MANFFKDVFDGVTGLIPGVGEVRAAREQTKGINEAADIQRDTARIAADAQRYGTDQTVRLNRDIYNQNRRDQTPFMGAGELALSDLQSYLYGTPVGGRMGQQFDLAGYRPEYQNELDTTYDLRNFNPEETAAYQWQKKRGLEDLARQLRSMGRGSGTVAANANARLLGDLNASEYDRGYARRVGQRADYIDQYNQGYNRLAGRKNDYENTLLNLIKTGQGAAGTAGTAGTNFAGNAGNAYMTQGNTLANLQTNLGTNLGNAALTRGQSQASMYQGLQEIPFRVAEMGLKAKGAGMF